MTEKIYLILGAPLIDKRIGGIILAVSVVAAAL